MPREIAKFRALEPLTIKGPNGPRAIGAGAEFEFEGKPGPALLPLNQAARKNKARAILAGPGPHKPVPPVRMAKSLGYAGTDPAEARKFINDFVRETASPSTSPSNQRTT